MRKTRKIKFNPRAALFRRGGFWRSDTFGKFNCGVWQVVFSSEVFLYIFLPLVYILYVAVRKIKVQNIILIIASLLFYAYGEPAAVALMIVSVVFNYVCGRFMLSEKFKKPVLVISVIFNIGMLFVFKYLSYTVRLIESIFGFIPEFTDIALPIGISFFTFQAMSYVIDAYRDKSCARKNILDIFLYISFFPQLIAGPIVKFDDIALQINRRSIDTLKTVEGIKRFICGLSKKVLIANTMGEVADTAFSANSSFTQIISMLTPAFVLMFVVGVIISTPVIRNAKARIIASGHTTVCYIGTAAGTMILLVLCILALSTASYNPFIYFRF